MDKGLINDVDASFTLSGKAMDASSMAPASLENTLQEVDGVEANVATGYLATEFLLWGQDLNGHGPRAEVLVIFGSLKKRFPRKAADWGVFRRSSAYLIKMIAKKYGVLFTGATLVIWGFVGSPAAASDTLVASYGSMLETCYANAGSTTDRHACIGAMSTACSAGEEGGETTLGIVSCLMAEAAVWDEYLNAEYQAARARAKAADADEAAYFPEFAKRADALLAAQRAWITFRDAECFRAYAEWGAGSMRNIASAGCQMQMTADRTIELRQSLEEF